MNELINRLVQEAGLTPDQARKAVETIAGFVKEKFPMLGGAVDQIFSAGGNEE
ncbi:HU family DNA-binding protein [Sediminibacterium soli]|uniref:HU family DNA-binding protein n=1 Tax=Sediminibacterium soli TaxID=2698829 RepID=UPI00137A6AA0|nr:HU family DNA-binding protein [Sediminibacterium soli]NCI45547.1 HU family DNA-binding protein [Sediminibacterium soli]